MTDYQKLSHELFELHNKIRYDPQSFIPILKERLNYYENNILTLPGKSPLKTFEGPSAVLECIEFLETAKSIRKDLKLCCEFQKAAEDHVKDIGQNGLFGHDGSDGSNLEIRAKRYGTYSGFIGENCDYRNDTAIDIMCSLLIDDGLSVKGHRNNIFDDSFTTIGVSAGPHMIFDHCCVIVYTSAYKTRIEEDKELALKMLQEEIERNRFVVTASIVSKTNPLKKEPERKPLITLIYHDGRTESYREKSLNCL